MLKRELKTHTKSKEFRSFLNICMLHKGFVLTHVVSICSKRMCRITICVSTIVSRNSYCEIPLPLLYRQWKRKVRDCLDGFFPFGRSTFRSASPMGILFPIVSIAFINSVQWKNCRRGKLLIISFFAEHTIYLFSFFYS